MQAAFQQPPIYRDFQIYEAITLQGLSTRRVAEQFHLSQTRVRQIASRVLAWIAQTLPQSTEADDKQLLRLAQHITADRLQYFYGELMDQWRATHQPRYMAQLVRIAMATSRLGVVAGTIDALGRRRRRE